MSETEKLIDPDCRAGKHASCVGGPCECACHQLCGYCGQRRADGRTHGRAYENGPIECMQ